MAILSPIRYYLNTISDVYLEIRLYESSDFVSFLIALTILGPLYYHTNNEELHSHKNELTVDISHKVHEFQMYYPK